MEFIVIVESVERVAVFQDTVAKALRMVNEGSVGFDESWRLGQVSMEVAILVTEWTINDHHPYNMLMGCICRHYLFLLKHQHINRIVQVAQYWPRKKDVLQLGSPSRYLRARTSAGTSKENNVEEEMRCAGP